MNITEIWCHYIILQKNHKCVTKVTKIHNKLDISIQLYILMLTTKLIHKDIFNIYVKYAFELY